MRLALILATFAILSAGQACAALSLGDCDVALHFSGPDKDIEARDLFTASEILFSSIEPEEFDKVIAAGDGADQVDVTETFEGADLRFRLSRPDHVPEDEDTASSPPQERLLLQPIEDGQARVLLVSGQRGASRTVLFPMLSGLTRDGNVFVIAPANLATCSWQPDELAEGVEKILKPKK